MKFLDEAKIFVKSGAGGNGCMSFHREARVEFGGPNGGNGGRGGHIYLECAEGLNTLIDFRYQQHYKAGRGVHGMGKDRTGKSGQDIVIKLPVGTQIFDENKEFMIADLTTPGEQVLLATGGEGGFGNAHFKSATNRAPRRTTPGGECEEFWIWLRLKLIADVGLVGLPNAGKSTYLSVVSRARPKIADFPFTTLVPQLGVVEIDGASFVMADIPGLIEGAHEGVGLGVRFLGHVERCRTLLHIIDIHEDNLAENYKIVRQELSEYGGDLDKKHEIIALNKIDLLSPEALEEKKQQLEKVTKSKIFLVSAVTNKGVKEIQRAIWSYLKKTRKPLKDQPKAKEPATNEPWSPI